MKCEGTEATAGKTENTAANLPGIASGRVGVFFSIHKKQYSGEAKNNLTGKTLKGRIPLGGSRILARINRTADVNTGYYTINWNYLVGDKDYTDYCTGNDYTWMYTAHLYEVNEDRGSLAIHAGLH